MGTVQIVAKGADGKLRPVAPNTPAPVCAPSLTGCVLIGFVSINTRTQTRETPMAGTGTYVRDADIELDAASKDGVTFGPDASANSRSLEPGQRYSIYCRTGEKLDLSTWYAESAFTPVQTAKRARASNVATITTGSAHGLAVGDVVAVSGLGGTGYNNVATTVTAVPTSTSFTYNNTGSNESETVDTSGSVERTQLLKILAD